MLRRASTSTEPFSWSYFIIAYGFSWLVWLPGVLASRDLFDLPVPAMALVILGAHGPLVSAMALTWRTEGRAGALRLLKRGFDLRLPVGWWVLMLLLPVTLGGAAVWLNATVSGYRPEFPLLERPWFIVPTFLYLFFIGGSVQEEYGWRGYALPRLLARWSPLRASMVLGLLWGVWHLPLFYIAGAGQAFMPPDLFLALPVAFGVFFTWFYLRTGGNLFTALWFHASINLSLSLFPPVEMRVGGDQGALLYLLILYVVVAALLMPADRQIWRGRRRADGDDFG
ncbi:MAG TPA: CPBP family intramembrane metalloprotease [Chloroflexi bacterium]|jgi:membrane protease YdiL (CAAX protease family)|nr:CPBP family intramembrane metalloprotease [Chloroflexota bacterium]